MKHVRMFGAATVGAAILATSVGPAAAQTYSYGYGNPYYGAPYRRHRDRGTDVGSVIAGVAIIGAIAAVAAASNRGNRGYGYGYDSQYGGAGQAADACAYAVSRSASGVRIGDVRPTRDGYVVRGTAGSSYGGNYGYGDRGDGFRCVVRYGRVERVDRNGYGW